MKLMKPATRNERIKSLAGFQFSLFLHLIPARKRKLKLRELNWKKRRELKKAASQSHVSIRPQLNYCSLFSFDSLHSLRQNILQWNQIKLLNLMGRMKLNHRINNVKPVKRWLIALDVMPQQLSKNYSIVIIGNQLFVQWFCDVTKIYSSNNIT